MTESNLNKNFLTPHDIAVALDRSENYAYKLIKQLNEELEAQGYIVIRARVPRSYFEKRVGVFFGGDTESR